MMPRHTQNGFTLIELLVAAAVFTLVATNATMLFVSAMGLQYQSTGIVKISENAQFAMESISREVRVSKITALNNSNGCSASLILDHPVNGIVTYSYSYDVPTAMGVLRRNGQNITSPDVSFTKFSFCISGIGPDNTQVRVAMPMSIVSRRGKPSTAVTVLMQTMVASRDITEDFSD